MSLDGSYLLSILEKKKAEKVDEIFSDQNKAWFCVL